MVLPLRSPYFRKCKATPVTGRGGLWDCETSRFPTFSRQSAHTWLWGCQSYAPAAPLTPGRFLVLTSVRGWVDPGAIMRLDGFEKSSDLVGYWTRDLPACSTVQPTTLPRVPCSFVKKIKNCITPNINTKNYKHILPTFGYFDSCYHYAVCVSPSSTSERLNQSLWKFVCISRPLRPSQRRYS
jgi:hypothetical protein